MRTHTTPSSIPGFEDPYSKLRLVSPILPKSLADPSISQPAKRTSAMQQGGGSIQRNGSGNSTSQRVQPSLSETLYDIIPSDEEHANHQQSSSQCRNTGSNGYTPVQSRPVLLHHYQQHSNGTQGGRQYLDYGRRQVRTYAIPLVILRSIDTQWFIYPAKVFLCMGTALGLRAIDLHWRNSID
ncbi:hypothetical protein PSPO01_00594 [Paraphaeosphaeria sporulosa]